MLEPDGVSFPSFKGFDEFKTVSAPPVVTGQLPYCQLVLNPLPAQEVALLPLKGAQS